jgi:beta-mannosidase
MDATKMHKQLPLSTNWRVYALNNSDMDTLPADIPGTIHTDLYRNDRIPDPFYGDNEQQLSWVEDQTWVYETTINLPMEVMNSKRINLIFEGLDTYADIYVNNNRERRTDNMFRSWTVSLNEKLHPGDNHVKVVFHPAKEIVAEKAKELPYFLPSGEANFARKAQYHFGWDWGPRFPTVGIWKPVYIEYYDVGKIDNIQLQQKELSGDKAMVQANFSIGLLEPGGYYLNCYVRETGESQTVILSGYPNDFTFDIEIKNPKRWNCNGYGEPNLYTIDFQLYQDDKLIDERTERIGLRTAELVQTPDSLGASFYFSINDKPVYAKGANMIPLDVFLPRVKREDYEQLIDRALDANFNMLRVWGGGVYEDDYFYDLCDEKGIMVWQDFMFACALYSGDSSFLSTVRYEVEEQIRRLRNHPSIVLWCGNNEVDEAWHNWGWQKQHNYSREDSVKIYADYQRLFHELIPSVLEKEDPSRSYHPSSPTHGWGRAESYVSGDQHYWGVWWGKEPFERYREKVGRFASEFGFQSFPNSIHFSEFIDKGNEDLTSTQWKNHQKHPVGFETIAEYMKRDYSVPTNLKDYAYVSQLLQARGMKIAIEAQRTRQPHCMGSLYWQLNDCWPVVSWSSIDYYGTSKAAHYAVKRAFEPNIITVKEMKSEYTIQLTTENNLHQKGSVTIELYSFDGTLLHSKSEKVNLPNNATATLTALSKRSVKRAKAQLNQAVLKIRVNTIAGELAECHYFFVPPKDMKLKAPVISMKWLSPGVLEVTNKDYLAKDLYLEPIAGRFSDNYFDLLPGSSRIIYVQDDKDNLSEYWMREQIYPEVKTLRNK